MNEYLNLYEAIWSQAVDNDIDDAIDLLFTYAFDKAYDYYQLSTKKPIEKSNKKFNKIKKYIKKYCEFKVRRDEVLINRIKELIYEETNYWPNNEYLKLKDEIYNKKMKILKVSAKEYAIERLEKSRRYLKNED